PHVYTPTTVMLHEPISTHPIISPSHQGDILTVFSPSTSNDQVKLRRDRFPSTIAEDMESFSVALAAHLFDLPCTVIRGVSNISGERDKSRWDIPLAMKE